jgi:hypothetical protein
MKDVVDRGRHFYANKTHCPRGHEYDEANTYNKPNGSRECRACRKARKLLDIDTPLLYGAT